MPTGFTRHYAGRYVQRFTVTAGSEQFGHCAQRIATRPPRRPRPQSSSRYAAPEKTSAPVFFTLRRLSELPIGITSERLGTSRVKALTWERYVCLSVCLSPDAEGRRGTTGDLRNQRDLHFSVSVFSPPPSVTGQVPVPSCPLSHVQTCHILSI